MRLIVVLMAVVAANAGGCAAVAATARVSLPAPGAGNISVAIADVQVRPLHHGAKLGAPLPIVRVAGNADLVLAGVAADRSHRGRYAVVIAAFDRAFEPPISDVVVDLGSPRHAKARIVRRAVAQSVLSTPGPAAACAPLRRAIALGAAAKPRTLQGAVESLPAGLASQDLLAGPLARLCGDAFGRQGLVETYANFNGADQPQPFDVTASEGFDYAKPGPGGAPGTYCIALATTSPQAPGTPVSVTATGPGIVAGQASGMLGADGRALLAVGLTQGGPVHIVVFVKGLKAGESDALTVPPAGAQRSGGAAC